MSKAFTSDHMDQLRRLGMGGYPCATYAAREIEQLNEYAYALEYAMVYGFSNREEVRGMIGDLRSRFAPDVEMPEVPYAAGLEESKVEEVEIDGELFVRRNGRLTAELVSDAVYANSIHADCADADWQAIAEELNAAMTCETCENVSRYAKERNHFKCSKCGCVVEDAEGYYVSVHSSDYTEKMPWGFCPNCGAYVVRRERV